MPLDGLQEWRARTGSSWYALGCPFSIKFQRLCGLKRVAQRASISFCLPWILVILILCDVQISEFLPIGFVLSELNN